MKTTFLFYCSVCAVCFLTGFHLGGGMHEPEWLVAKPGACDPAKTQVFNLRGQERGWQMNDPRAKCSLVLRGER